MPNIAVVRRNGLGDLLCTCPLINYIKKYFIDARVTLFVEPHNSHVVPFLPNIDAHAVIPNRGNKYWNATRVACRYRKQRFDIAISGKTTPMRLVNWFLYLLGAKQRVAAVGSGWDRYLINAPVKLNDNERMTHQALRTLRTIAPHLKEVPSELFPKLQLPDSLEQCFPLPTDVPQGAPVLLLSASNTHPTNRMDVKRYAHLANMLIEAYSFYPLVLSLKKDGLRAQALCSELKGEHTLYFPRCFEAFMVALNRSAFYLIGDSGVGHLGAALNKPQLVWFGESHPSIWGPMGEKVKVLYHPHHVNYIPMRKIEKLLMEHTREVFCERSCD